MESTQILKTFKLEPNINLGRAVERVREHLDRQPNPLRYANTFLKNLSIPAIDNQKKAYVYVMTAVESAMNNQINIEQIIERANSRINHITDMMGPGAFYVPEDNIEVKPGKSGKSVRHGSKSESVREIYFENKDKLSDKEILDLIQEELDISKNNAYTYLYNLKKKLNKK